MGNNKLNKLIRELYKTSEEFTEQLVEVDESEYQIDSHEKDWMRKNQWKQPWYNKRSKKR